MGCVGSARDQDGQLRGKPAKKHDVFITCTNTVLAKEDFSCFFSEWISRLCVELKLTSTDGRPHFGSEEPKPGSRKLQQLESTLLKSRIIVCILNLSPGDCDDVRPAGYRSEMCLANQASIPVVPFYDADRYKWKEVVTWKAELPLIFRSGLTPTRYHREYHSQAKEALTASIRTALNEAHQEEKRIERRLAGEDEGKSPRSAQLATDMWELSRAERRLKARKGQERERPEDDDMENRLGLDRSDYERAGLLEKRLERTNSMKDITVETALTLLAKRAKSNANSAAGRFSDLLAAREGGCRLKFVDGGASTDKPLGNGAPAHRILMPAHGILKKKGDVKRSKLVPVTNVKQLRLADGDLDERRFRFSVQQLEKHLSSLQVDDVHELATVLQCLQDGLEEDNLVKCSLRLLSAFLESHSSLHGRAIQQNAIPAVIAVMRRYPEVDYLVHGTKCLLAILESSQSMKDLDNAEVVEDNASTPDAVTLIAKAGGVEVIVDGMRRYPASELIQLKGIKCFGFLARGGGQENRVSADYKKGKKQESAVMLRGQARRLITRHGGVHLLTAAMQRFTKNPDLQASACMAVGQIGSTERRVKKEAGKEGGIVSLIFDAVALFPKSAAVQRCGCAALKQLSSNSTSTKDAIARRGGIELLNTAAKQFIRSDRQVLFEALGGLCHLASKHPGNKQRMFELGVLELTLEALRVDGDKLAEADVAMAACGLLHNLACSDAIKRHIVKLGGREVAERLESHEVDAVKNLAKMLKRTLAPPAETGGDPFGSIFATRGNTTTAKRVPSKHGRKAAKAALQSAGMGAGDVEDGDVQSDTERHESKASDHALRATADDAASEGGSSAASSGSNYSYGGTQRRSGGRRPNSSRRFSSAWDADGGEEQRVPTAADWSYLDSEASTGIPEDDDDTRSVVSSSAASVVSDAESHLSLEANSCMGEDVDLASAIEALGYVRIRREGEEKRRRMKQRKRPGAAASAAAAAAAHGPSGSPRSNHSGSARGAAGAVRGSPSAPKAYIKEQRTPSEAPPSEAAASEPSERSEHSQRSVRSVPSVTSIRSAASRMSEKFMSSVTELEKRATNKLDKAGHRLNQAPVELAAKGRAAGQAARASLDRAAAAGSRMERASKQYHSSPEERRTSKGGRRSRS